MDLLIALLIVVVVVVVILWLLDQMPLGRYALPLRVVIVAIALIYVLTRLLPVHWRC